MWYLVLIEWVQQVHGLAKHNMQHHLWSQEDLLRVIQKAVLRKRKHANVPQYPKCLRHGTTYVYSRKHKLCSLTHNCREVGHTTFFSWRITSYFTTQSMSSDTTNTLHNTNTTCIVAWHTTYVPQHKTFASKRRTCSQRRTVVSITQVAVKRPRCKDGRCPSSPFFPIPSYPFFPSFLFSFLPSFLPVSSFLHSCFVMFLISCFVVASALLASSSECVGVNFDLTTQLSR